MNTSDLRLLLGRRTIMPASTSADLNSRLPSALLLTAALLLPMPLLLAQDGVDAASAESVDAAAAAGGETVADATEVVAAEPPVPQGQPQPAEMSPRAVHGLLVDIAYTGERLVAVGERGNIVASRDGTRWAQVEVPARATLTGLSFVDAQYGWAVGHDTTILHTSDGGRTWALQNFQPDRFKPLHDVLFVDRSRGWVLGAFGTFLATTDGGKTWTDVRAPAVLEEGYHLNGLTRLKDGQMLVVGESGLLGLSADGETWERLESPYEGSYFGAVPRGEKGAVVFGLRGNAYVSDDVRAGGWRKINLATVSSIFGGVVMGDGSIVLVGADAAVLTLMPDESVERIATFAGVAGSGTLSAVARWPGGLMTAGEAGVQPYQTKLKPTAAPVVTRELETTSEFH